MPDEPVQTTPEGYRPDDPEADEQEALATIKMYAHLTGIQPSTPAPEPDLPVDQDYIPIGDPVIATGEDYTGPA